MAKRKGNGFEPDGLTIAYKELGTMHIDEFAQALLADIQALKEIYNVHYVKNPRLRIHVTNEYGEEYDVRRPVGGRIFYMDTHHYRPACKDYEL